jgi:sugar phosphate isomerase/epimerase
LQIGVASELLGSLPLQEVIASVADTGFQAIEIWLDHWQYSGLHPKQLLRYLRSSGLVWNIHVDIRDVNITSANDGIRRESVKQVERAIHLASAVEARVLTVHPGRLTSVKKDCLEDFWSKQVEVFYHLAEIAAGAGVQLGVENMQPSSKEFVVHLDDVIRLLTAVDNPNLGVTLDLAHLFGQPGTDEFITKVPCLVNVHLSDAAPGCRHLPLGQGELDYISLLDILGERYNGTVILEGFVPGWEGEILPYLFNKWQEYRLKV